MATPPLRFRQIHMDFHISGEIAGIGSAFDAGGFADTLERARVYSVICFAHCHHGWMYFDSKRFPERIHPSLDRKNLLTERIEACHRRGIRVPPAALGAMRVLEQSAHQFDIIEDVIPIHDLGISIPVDKAVQSVRLAPQEIPVSYEQEKDCLTFRIPCFDGHQIVEVVF